MRTHYESAEYECEGQPGTFAGITICGDDDGPHFVFASGDQVYLDLPIPCGEALAISYALGRSAKAAIVAAEHLADNWLTDAGTGHEEAPPEPVMTYGPRELPAERERLQLPRAADRFMERAPGYSPPAAWTRQFGRQPAA